MPYWSSRMVSVHETEVSYPACNVRHRSYAGQRSYRGKLDTTADITHLQERPDTLVRSRSMATVYPASQLRKWIV
jgi:hypothetical protein